jgi:hypothetical protein
MEIDALVSESSALRQSQAVGEMQVKLVKGALQQEGEVVMTLIEGAVQGAPRPTGRLLDVVA